ncbi:hypothetical protein GCM10022241_09360 [Micrococcus endophyticus]
MCPGRGGGGAGGVGAGGGWRRPHSLGPLHPADRRKRSGWRERPSIPAVSVDPKGHDTGPVRHGGAWHALDGAPVWDGVELRDARQVDLGRSRLALSTATTASH